MKPDKTSRNLAKVNSRAFPTSLVAVLWFVVFLLDFRTGWREMAHKKGGLQHYKLKR